MKMQRTQLNTLTIGALSLIAGMSVRAGDGVDVTITNDGIDDIVVTVYDLSIGPKAVVISHERINGNASIPISVSMDASGNASLSWTAISADANGRKCGHGDHVGLGNAGSLAVHADSECTTPG
jgi:hypothetical protein